MKQLAYRLITILLFLAAIPVVAQSPLSWRFSLEDMESGEVALVAKVTVEQGMVHVRHPNPGGWAHADPNRV